MAKIKKVSSTSGRIHVAEKATASEIRGAVGVTMVHNRSAVKALQKASPKTVVSGFFVVSGKNSDRVVDSDKTGYIPKSHTGKSKSTKSLKVGRKK